jgi:hypothetical protein
MKKMMKGTQVICVRSLRLLDQQSGNGAALVRGRHCYLSDGWHNSQHCLTSYSSLVPDGLLAPALRLHADNNFVRILAACETMGGATAICSDKTGACYGGHFGMQC